MKPEMRAGHPRRLGWAGDDDRFVPRPLGKSAC
jgi:hypothetical protein